MTDSFSSLEALLHTQLRHLLAAERHQTGLLLRMREAAEAPALRHCFATHHAETQRQIERLEQACERLGLPTGPGACGAMTALGYECEQVLTSEAEPVIRDLALIACAQRIEHYEMAAYGAARTVAEICDQPDIADLLQDTLGEEGQADKTLVLRAGERYSDAARLSDPHDASWLATG